MKRLIALFAIVLGCASAAWAAPPTPLATLHAVHALSHAEAAKLLPAAFEATVTYRRAGETTLFVEDAGEGIYVWASADIKLAPGDRVLVRGTAHDSFRPIVTADSVTLLHHGGLPQAIPATFDELIRGERDCVLVSVRAVVQSADLGSSAGRNDTHLILLAGEGAIDTYVDSGDASVLDGLLDAEVEVTGVAGARFDGKMQQTGVDLSVPSFAQVKILKRAEASPWSLPVTQMDGIIANYRVKDLSRRVHVQGTITYYQPALALVLQNGRRSLWIQTTSEKPLHVGYQADVTGFPYAHEAFLTLTGGEIQESQVYAPITPRPVTVTDLAASRHIYDLVSIEGQVIMEVRENSQDEYVLVSNGQVFSAIHRHPSGSSALPPMKQIPIGSGVRVTGICIVDNSNPFSGDVPFDILMRTPDDIAVVAQPSIVTVRNLIILVGLLLAVVIVVVARGWAIEYKVRWQTAALAVIEQRRSRILEDINGSRPLAEVVEEITELVSFKLQGAPCWCQVADGAKLGNCPQKLAGLRVVQSEIPAHKGPPLGTLYAAFDLLAKPSADEPEALSMAVALTALAIETRRLYSDLVHRSEFDLLTDIHNRFSLDKYLDQQIEEARQDASIFGLIYIDLDWFKQVNDIYGHQSGDLFLQEVALRMKRQLRGGDMLARLGGDEFAALLPRVRSRARVEEIAQRLERCFDEPFVIEEHRLRGSASIGIALYPEDGATKDELLSAADAAMYAVKTARHEIGTEQAAHEVPLHRKEEPRRR
jgi:diguanylate cyclase (GGDEF)-like protein